jgi:hypothetical protein
MSKGALQGIGNPGEGRPAGRRIPVIRQRSG